MAEGIHDLKFIESVNERDIDLLILEELQVCQEFRDWLSSRVFERPIFKSHKGAWHSVNDATLGESDLVFIFQAEDGTTEGTSTAILIENKIDAAAQPDQGKRYAARGQKGVTEGYWQEFRTCIIAPRRYLQSPIHTESYDCAILYEEIMAYFIAKRSTDARHNYRAKIVLEGIKQNRRGYQPKISDQMTEFVTAYWKLVQSEYSQLGMPEPKPRPAGSTWINFYPNDFPKGVDVVHQLTAGFVKVFFAGKASEYELIATRYKELGEIFNGFEIQLSGKSVSLSVPVEIVRPLETSFAEARPAVSATLTIVNKLVEAVRRCGFSSPSITEVAAV